MSRTEQNSEALASIAKSLETVADALSKKPASRNGTRSEAEWLHIKPHRVECSVCGCQVSINAACNMKYCFECGSKIKEVQV